MLTAHELAKLLLSGPDVRVITSMPYECDLGNYAYIDSVKTDTGIYALDLLEKAQLFDKVTCVVLVKDCDK